MKIHNHNKSSPQKSRFGHHGPVHKLYQPPKGGGVCKMLTTADKGGRADEGWTGIWLLIVIIDEQKWLFKCRVEDIDVKANHRWKYNNTVCSSCINNKIETESHILFCDF